MESVNPLSPQAACIGVMKMCCKFDIRWHSVLFNVILAATVAFSSPVSATDAQRQQAKRIYDRLAGVPPTNAVLDDMEQDIQAGNPEAAAMTAMENPSFYNVTLKNFVTPWTNEAQDVFAPLNDYTATVIGLIRDDIDFREVLYGDVVYVGNVSGVPAYSNSNNDHYEALESQGVDLSDLGKLQNHRQSDMNPALPATATAGVMTTRAAAEAFFSGGTNRLMFRATMMHYLCSDLEPLKDVTRIPDHVRRDVSRSPGGDSRIFLNSCVGCHAGMDGMAGAFARYEYNETTMKMEYQPEGAALVSDKFDVNGVAVKYNINPTNFAHGYVTTDDSWVNYWRKGQNQLLGWRGPSASGNGAKSLGIELANTQTFSTCQVKKVFKAVCFRDADDYALDRAEVNLIANAFENGQYKMKNVFAKVAAYCTAP